MSSEELPPIHKLTREEMQDLIDEMELDVTVDDLMLVAQALALAGDSDELREALGRVTKAA